MDTIKMLQRAHDSMAESTSTSTTNTKDASAETSDVAAQLEAEKEELRKEGNKFEVISDSKIPDGVCFVKFNKTDKFQTKPSDLADTLLNRVVEKKDMSKNVMKLSPLDYLCKPHLEQFKALAEKEIKPLFATKEGEKKPVW